MTRHFDIEEQHRGGVLIERAQCLQAVLCFGANDEFRP